MPTSSSRNLAVASDDYFYINPSDTAILHYETPNIGQAPSIGPEPDIVLPEIIEETEEDPIVCCAPNPEANSSVNDEKFSITRIVTYIAFACLGCCVLFSGGVCIYYCCCIDKEVLNNEDFDKITTMTRKDMKDLKKLREQVKKDKDIKIWARTK